MAIAFDASTAVTATSALVISAQLVTVNNISAGAVANVFCSGGKSFSAVTIAGAAMTLAGQVTDATNRSAAFYSQNNAVTATSHFRCAVNGGGGGVNLSIAMLNFTKVSKTNMFSAFSAVLTTSTTFALTLACGSADVGVGFTNTDVGSQSVTAGWTIPHTYITDVYSSKPSYKSASGATSLKLEINGPISIIFMQLMVLSGTAVGSAAPSTGFVGGLAMMGCGLKVRWTLEDLFPPPFLPDPA